jgi:hypothetical protein
MVLLWIWRWWRLGVSCNVCLCGVRVWRLPLATASAGNHMYVMYFLFFRVLYVKFPEQLFVVFYFSCLCIHVLPLYLDTSVLATNNMGERG